MGVTAINANPNLKQRKNHSHVFQQADEREVSFASLLQTSLASVSELKNIRQKKREKISLASLMEDLDTYEDNLLVKPDHRNFLRYRDQIRKITTFILKEQFSIKTIRDRRQKEFEVVHYIDQNLAVILQEILHRNPDTVMILRLMGEVRGLILDVQG